MVAASCGGGEALPEPEGSVQGAVGTWETGPSVGTGVAFMDTGNVLGENVFVGYAGFNINLAQAQAWVATLYDARLRALGVRYLFAVQGPADSLYNGLEIGNSKIAAALNRLVSPRMGFIVVAGHSSGSFVADELLQQLDTGADPSGALGSRLVYFDLDGDQRYVAASGINRLRRAYYVNAYSAAAGTASYNHAVMNSLGAAFAGKGGTYQYEASGSGCTGGGVFCVHIALINTHPHDPQNGSGIDYADFGGRPVNFAWLDAKEQDAALGQCNAAVSTKGAILYAYALLGGCGSFLGAPTTDELGTPDGRGRYNHFQGGSIYFTFFTGAHEVHGAIRALWASLGWERSALGYPISDQHLVQGEQRSDFEHGSIALRADGTAYVVPPPSDAGPAMPADAGPHDAGAHDAGPGPGGADAGALAFAAPPLRSQVLVLPGARGPAADGAPLEGGCSVSSGPAVLLLAAALLRRRRALARSEV
ncbi:MAG: hypothetical protein K1X89_06095 [Myxococcaceae bacterium]|nr:hypothetical protein [Myxococcaceae bacterium]